MTGKQEKPSSQEPARAPNAEDEPDEWCVSRAVVGALSSPKLTASQGPKNQPHWLRR